LIQTSRPVLACFLSSGPWRPSLSLGRRQSRLALVTQLSYQPAMTSPNSAGPLPSPSFQGIDNFRDFGGYPTPGGRWVKRGKLYRSAHHGRATEADLAALSALGLSAVVDLRRTEERDRDPGRRWAPFGAVVI